MLRDVAPLTRDADQEVQLRLPTLERLVENAFVSASERVTAIDVLAGAKLEKTGEAPCRTERGTSKWRWRPTAVGAQCEGEGHLRP